MNKIIGFLVFSTLLLTANLFGQKVTFHHQKGDTSETFILENSKVKQEVVIKEGLLLSDTLQSKATWTQTFHRPATRLISDADFNIRVVYNAWRAPGKDNNADNPVEFSKKNFAFDHFAIAENTGDKRQVDLYFKGTNNPFVLRISYQLGPDDFYVRRKLILKDPTDRGHFLDRISPRDGRFSFSELSASPNGTQATIGIEGLDNSYSESVTLNNETDSRFAIVKNGGFGQPVVFANGNGSGFVGLEYPTETSVVKQVKNGLFSVNSFQYFGHKIEPKPIESSWEVTAVAPQPYAKKWFFTYVDAIRVAPAKPYTLYNSWYDLRSVAFAKMKKNKGGDDYQAIPSDAIMNEKNTLRIINLLKKNMIEKNGIHLDAFVLDDGWDVYESAWKLRKKQFPNGLRPISDTLAKMGTRLGLWFSPIGGYSFAMRRVKWMGEHGYEVTGHKYESGSAMLCLAGKNYSKLFRKRITDFTRDDHVGFYKWDGIQFACSEPDHGHPVGIYSRRAVMESVIDKCKAVRAIDPNVYLNITSGTWLSPWWLQYTNQIWMDAADYAFSDVPSISRRDNAMTYRDYALYDDFKVRKLWFPVANLMTHGIIKGRLENITKGGEPIDRFTNNAVLYFARGVSMWELYISPDILTKPEWSALSQSIQWAKAHQDVMATTFMVGGNPAKGEAYGYAHFKGEKGLIAVRNPKVQHDVIRFRLKPEYGLNEEAANLVVEQVYPFRKILPQLYSAGGELEIALNGFETAIFDVYTMESTERPLLADAVFSLKTDKNILTYQVEEAGKNIHFLQPQKIESMTVDGQKAAFNSLQGDRMTNEQKPDYSVTTQKTKKSFTYTIRPKMMHNTYPAEVALLLKNPKKKGAFPEVIIRQGKKKLKVNKQSIHNKWAWYSVELTNSQKDIVVVVNTQNWSGQSELWANSVQKRHPFTLQVSISNRAKPEWLPPLPYPQTESRNYLLLKKENL